MRETIAWSYELLNQAEQRLFRRLAVFAGGCSLTTVGAMFEATGDDRVEVLDRVEALQRSSLLQLEEAEAEDPRFRMLETIREYAVEQLQASGEEEELRQWHATHYLEFAEEAARRFYSPDTALSLGRLEREHDNLRAAVRWHIDRQNVDAGLRLGGALWWFWYVRGYSTEGQAQLAALLALPKPAGDGVPRAAVLLGAGQLAQTQGDYKKARALLDESIALYRAKADERGTADALLAAGFVARVQEDHITARALLEEALELSRGIGYPFITAAALHHLGMMQTDVQGDYTAARKLLEESLTLYRALGFPRFIALLLLALADVGIAEGDHVSADASLRQSLMTMTLVGEKLGIYEALDTFAHLSATEGQAERTVRLAGAATRLRSADGTYSWPVKERCRERWLASARAALDEEAFKRAWDEGQAMTREQAIDYALRR
jgi:non-specific serine/threonine protein kinase